FGLNPYTLTCQLILASARTCGLAALHAGLLSVTALAQTVGRIIGLIAGIHWLISSRRRAESAPKILPATPPIAAQPSYAVLNKRDTLRAIASYLPKNLVERIYDSGNL